MPVRAGPRQQKSREGSKLKRQADHDEMIQRPEQTLEHKNKTGTSLEYTMQELNQRIKIEEQKQAVDSETETANLQIEKLAAKIEKEVSLLKAKNEGLSQKNKELDDRFLVRQKAALESLELKLEQEKQTRMRLESTIQKLHQEILKTGKDREHIDEEIEHITLHEQMLITELK